MARGAAGGGLAPTRLAPVTLSLPLCRAPGRWRSPTARWCCAAECTRDWAGRPNRSCPGWLHAALAEARGEIARPGSSWSPMRRRTWTSSRGAKRSGCRWRRCRRVPAGARPRRSTCCSRRTRRADAPPVSRAPTFLRRRCSPRGWWEPSRSTRSTGCASRARRAPPTQEMRALLMKSFPETRAILDAPEQMRRGLETSALRSGAGARPETCFRCSRARCRRSSANRAPGCRDSTTPIAPSLCASRPPRPRPMPSRRRCAPNGLEVDVQRAGGEARLRVRPAALGEGNAVKRDPGVGRPLEGALEHSRSA